jgi:hypothetical protein
MPQVAPVVFFGAAVFEDGFHGGGGGWGRAEI